MSNYLLLTHKAKLAIGELDSNVNVGLPITSLDILTNRGIRTWFREFTKQLEANQGIHDRLSNLVVRTPMTAITSAPGFQNPLLPASTETDTYEFRFADLDYEYHRFMHAYAMISKDDCPAVRGAIRIEQFDDLNTVLIDDNRKPSWKYREVVGVFHRDGQSYTELNSNTVKSSLTLYTDNFNIETLHLTYLKEPNAVCFGGYTDLDGNVTTRVECDIDPFYYDEIVQFIAAEAQQIYGFTNNNQ